MIIWNLLTSSSEIFCKFSGQFNLRISGSQSVTTQSEGTSQFEGPSSPMIVNVGNWRDNDAIIHLCADLSASVWRSFFP